MISGDYSAIQEGGIFPQEMNFKKKSAEDCELTKMCPDLSEWSATGWFAVWAWWRIFLECGCKAEFSLLLVEKYF